MVQIRGTEIAPSKIEQIKRAGERQLSPKEYEELVSLLYDLQIYGLTPWINVRLGTLMSKIEFVLEIEPSPEWSEALQACDETFLGTELKAICFENAISPVGHKKILCRKLYEANVPEVVEVMEPYLHSHHSLSRVQFNRADIDSAIGAAKRLKSDKDLYVFATYLGYTIDRRPPPGMQSYVIVHSDGMTETIKPGG